jgi:predicted DNA-binding transcriptional regulator AlpA
MPPKKSDDADFGPLLISAKALAKLLDVSDRTIQRLCQRSKMPKPIHFGRNARWRLDIITKWIDDGCPQDSKEQ